MYNYSLFTKIILTIAFMICIFHVKNKALVKSSQFGEVRNGIKFNNSPPSPKYIGLSGGGGEEG